MKRSLLTMLVLCLALLAAIVLGPSAIAKDKKAKEGQLNGMVRMINKDTSTITVTKGSIQQQIVYNSETKWAYGTQADNKPSSLDALKDGWYVNCRGTFDGVKLLAAGCRFREAK